MGLPLESRKGLSETAAVKMRSGALPRSVCKNESKLALSLGSTALQPIPCLLGYSQLRAGERTIFQRIKRERTRFLCHLAGTVRRHLGSH